MIRPLVRLSVLPLVAFALDCGEGREAASESPRRVVVRGADPAAPPSAANGIELGPSAEAAPEIVILPDPAPESRTRVVHETVVVDPPEAPAPSGSEADMTGAGAVLPAPRPDGPETAAESLSSEASASP